MLAGLAMTWPVFSWVGNLILRPLIAAGEHGVEIVGSDGDVHRVHPILTCYATEYPEQTAPVQNSRCLQMNYSISPTLDKILLKLEHLSGPKLLSMTPRHNPINLPSSTKSAWLKKYLAV